jgi:hypothetical protein
MPYSESRIQFWLASRFYIDSDVAAVSALIDNDAAAVELLSSTVDRRTRAPSLFELALSVFIYLAFSGYFRLAGEDCCSGFMYNSFWRLKPTKFGKA